MPDRPRPVDLLARQLPILHGVHAHDAAGDVAIGDALHLEGMEAAKGGDLLETERSVVDQPDGSGLGHQQGRGHDKNSLSGAAGYSPARPAFWHNAKGGLRTIYGDGSGFSTELERLNPPPSLGIGGRDRVDSARLGASR
jgi:hypothetical protein